MSSVIFRPLLHDPLGWKSSNSTYADHYKWRKYRATNKDKKISSYGQQYQMQLQKQQTNDYLPIASNQEQTVKRAVTANKTDDNQGQSVSYRCSALKTPAEQPPVYIVEYKQRPTSTNGVSLLEINFEE
jgi:hypothetical protein